MKAGFIGYRNFAAKLAELFEQSGLVEQFIFYHPDKTIEGLPYSNRLEDLFDCDFIVIASPDCTHGSYLRQLQDFGGYIFCEKVPVMNREDLSFLQSRSNPLLYFDFCYRKSRLCSLLQELSGEVLYINHRFGHGLALTERYKDNWRSDASKAPLGVFQLSGIHFFDLLIFCFGRPVSYHVTARNLSTNGDSIDNFAISMEFPGGLVSDLFFSYTAPYQFNINIITTENLYELDGTDFSVRGPRETYDERGLFANPAVLSHEVMDLYGESLKASVSCFLDVVESKGHFYEASLENNLLSTELFLDILDKVGKAK